MKLNDASPTGSVGTGEMPNIKLGPADFYQSDDVHVNIRQRVIITTEDKVRLCLGQAITQIRKGYSWLAPLGLLVSLVASILATDFKDSFGVPAATWHALFIFGGIGASIWLIVAVVARVRAPSIDAIVEQMKLNPDQSHHNSHIYADGKKLPNQESRPGGAGGDGRP